MTFRELVQVVLQGGPGVCQVALTNACNARCRFCSFPLVPAGERCMADFPRLARGLEAMHRAGIRYLIFTGGEPLLYPELVDTLTHAHALGLESLLVTNGALLTPKLIRRLREVRLKTLIVSIDAASGETHDHHRGLPGLTDHLREVLPQVRLTGIKAVASVTLSRLIDNLDALAAFVQGLGFSGLTFSYPLTQLDSSYLGFADSDLVAFTPEELDHLFAQIVALKARTPMAILNPRLALEEARRQLRGLPSRFPCLAGYKYFYVDWHLQVYRCHFLSDTLGPLEDIDCFPLIRDGCNACSIDCYRDPSVYQFVAVSLADSLAAWRRGHFLTGLKALLHPHNALSLAALLEGRHWLQ